MRCACACVGVTFFPSRILRNERQSFPLAEEGTGHIKWTKGFFILYRPPVPPPPLPPPLLRYTRRPPEPPFPNTQTTLWLSTTLLPIRTTIPPLPLPPLRLRSMLASLERLRRLHSRWPTFQRGRIALALPGRAPHPRSTLRLAPIPYHVCRPTT
jgi:hypothetical protein